jgi:lipopolysaccharide exporter
MAAKKCSNRLFGNNGALRFWSKSRSVSQPSSLGTESLGSRMTRGVGWMALFKLAERGIGLLGTVILARLLLPSDFGLVAMSISVVALLELMSAFGFDVALIQRPALQRGHYDTVWTFNILLATAIAVLLLLLSVPAASFYAEPRLELILPVLAIGVFVGGFENIGVVAFRRELNFRREFQFLILKRVATFAVSIGLAVAYQTYWALIAGTVVGKFFGVALSYVAHPYRPRLSLQLRHDLFSFSKWLFFLNCVHLFQQRFSDFVLGRSAGAHGLGIYNIALEIALLPTTELVAPINRAVFPGYARLLNNPIELRARFFDVFGIIALLAFPAAVGLASIAAPAVEALLGDNWTEAIPLVRSMAIAGLFGALLSNLYVVIIAAGRARAITITSAGILVFALPLFVIAAVRYGLSGAAWAYVGTSLLTLLAMNVVFFHVTGFPVKPYLSRLWRPAAASLVLSAGLYAVDVIFLEAMPNLYKLAWLIATGAVIYALAIWALWRLSGNPTGSEQRVLEFLHPRALGRSSPFP